MDLRREMAFAFVSNPVSAGDGVAFAYQKEVPPGTAASNVMHSLAEMFRRCYTYVMSPSATLVSGNSAGAVALTLGTTGPSGVWGMFQGQPFYISATGTLSAQPAAAISTTSYQMRKVLVALALSNFWGNSAPGTSSLAGTTTLQFTYGSAMLTSANAVNSGGNQVSFFDAVPMPLASAGEVPIGWINVPNSFAVSAGLSASMLYSDLRVLQGYDMTSLLQGRAQP
jgi:hypothetical protein